MNKRIQNKLKCLIFILALSFSATLYADAYSSLNFCYEPRKLDYYSASRTASNFRQEMNDYILCLSRYIKKQQAGLFVHQDNINAAMKELDKVRAK